MKKFILKFFNSKNTQNSIVEFTGLHNMDLTDWWTNTFTHQERSIIYQKFYPNFCDMLGNRNRSIFTENNFAIEDEAVIPFMENLSTYMRNYDDITSKIFLKFLDISKIDPICDSELLSTSKDYKNWFILRQLILYNIKNFNQLGVKRVSFNDGNYAKAIDECKSLNGKKFDLNESIILEHWKKYKPTCRCVLLPEIEEGLLVD